MLNIKQIQYFAACAKTGSFSQAAELLFTTQSNVSKVIRSMEDVCVLSCLSVMQRA